MADAPVFGFTRVEGIHASEDSPIKWGIYVETVTRTGMNTGKHYRVTDGRGRFWLYPVESVRLHLPPEPRP